MSVRFEIRAALPRDEEQVLALAQHLNTVNLPHDRGHVNRLLEHSKKSFAAELRSVTHRKYVFVLWDLEKDRAVGTSMVVAQLGRRDAPYIYLEVTDEEKYSRTLDQHFHHTVLRIGFSYKGPTEIGGLVVLPEYRAAKERLGLMISYVRFLFIAAHRDLFQAELLAELLPPLESDGTSHLWEALGRRFCNMSYAAADLLSSENKEFIRDLFPSGDIYASLLAQDAQDVIGKVGAQTKGVEKMLKRIGFRYAHRVDPFDGGPHFTAATDEVSLIRATEQRALAGPLTEATSAPLGLCAREQTEAPFFRAIPCAIGFEGKHRVRLPAAVIEHLGLAEGDSVACLPVR
jgi:arginine N-succinyltransferase